MMLSDAHVNERWAELNSYAAMLHEAAIRHSNTPTDMNLLDWLNAGQALSNRLSSLAWDLSLSNVRVASAYYAELMTAIATVRSEQITNQVNTGEIQ
jgi:hypothetical protein